MSMVSGNNPLFVDGGGDQVLGNRAGKISEGGLERFDRVGRSGGNYR